MMNLYLTHTQAFCSKIIRIYFILPLLALTIQKIITNDTSTTTRILFLNYTQILNFKKAFKHKQNKGLIVGTKSEIHFVHRHQI